uniref:Uncharacterized protein n=1 Tax=Acrobeloides nanus TaxID=290746 RepID=A0A914DQW3_9BILA
MRTNNTLEGFNYRINDCMQEMHPTLWKFIEKLKKLDESIYSDYIQWLDGREPTISKRFQQMESQKLAVVRSYPNIGRMEFLRAVANRLAD